MTEPTMHEIARRLDDVARRLDHLSKTTGNPGNESPQGSRPVPDPTTLTTEQLMRATANLKELLAQKIDDNHDLYMDKFRAGEEYRIELKTDTKDAVDAALSAAKEAVRENNDAFTTATNKTEKAFTDQLAQLTLTFTTGIKSVSDKVDDVKQRVAKVEASRLGSSEGMNAVRSNATAVLVAVGVGVSLLALVATIVLALVNPR